MSGYDAVVLNVVPAQIKEIAMRKITKIVPLLIVVLLAAIACGSAEEAAAPEPTVRFVTPRDGDTVSSPVQVQMSVINYEIDPAGEVVEGSGHFHVMVDIDCIEEGTVIPGTEGHYHYGKAQTEAEIEMEPGEHTLCLQIGDGIHTATTLIDTITITVE